MQCYTLKSLHTDGIQMVLKITLQLSFHRKSRMDGICYNEQYHKIETHLDSTEPKTFRNAVINKTAEHEHSHCCSVTLKHFRTASEV